MNTLSDERIVKINTSSKLELKRRGDSAVEFYNAVLSRVCKNISHKYMNGINCIYLNYHRQGHLTLDIED